MCENGKANTVNVYGFDGARRGYYSRGEPVIRTKMKGVIKLLRIVRQQE